VVLIFKVLAVIIVIVVFVGDLPGHRAVSYRHFGLRCGRGGFAAKVEASQAEGARHDSSEDLYDHQCPVHRYAELTGHT
jgi:hypothetical protein